MFEINRISKNQDQISIEILKRMYPQSIESTTRTKKSLEDIKWLLLYIKESFIAKNDKLVINLIKWLKIVFKGLEIDPNNANLLFYTTKAVLIEMYADDEFMDFLEGIDITSEDDILELTNKLQKEQSQYLNLILNSKRSEAQEFIYGLFDQDISIEDIYLHIFQETMRQVGNLWQQHKISVATEHYCTAVTQFIMSNMYNKVLNKTKKNKRIIVCAVGSELHEIGIRMVADFFEMDGWEVRYLGPNLPVKEITKFALDFHPDFIALSITMPHHVSILKDTIVKLRSYELLKDTKIIVGGIPFLDNEDLVNYIQADAYAKDALEGVIKANEFFV